MVAMKRIKTFVVLTTAIAAGYFFPGCATILDGSTTPLTVMSTPAKASVTVYGVKGQKMGTGQLLNETFKITRSTPATIDLPKNDDYQVLIRMKGYKDVSLSVGRTPGNSFYVYLGLDILTTFGVGALIDWAGHSWDKEYLVCNLIDHSDKVMKQYSFPLEKL
jgi:hypothetical protein